MISNKKIQPLGQALTKRFNILYMCMLHSLFVIQFFRRATLSEIEYTYCLLDDVAVEVVDGRLERGAGQGAVRQA